MPHIRSLASLLGSSFVLLVVLTASSQSSAPAQEVKNAPAYHIYAGNTHSHTSFTWSHGEQWQNAKPAAGEEKKPLIYVDADGKQYQAKTQVLKPNWEKVQGPPDVHFALAKSKGYDFYVTTDHSQEAAFQPPGATNANWVETKDAAQEATDANFVAIAGYEHS